MWFFLSILAGFLFTATALLNKRVLRGGRDPIIFAFFFSSILAVVSVPLVLVNYSAPVFSNFIPWLFIFGVSLLFSLHNFVNFTAQKYLDASVHGTFYKLRLVWAFLIAVMIGQDSWSLVVAVGVLMTVLAGVVLLWQKENKLSTFGIVLVVSASVINAIALVLFKYSFDYFGTETAIFITAAVPAIIILCVVPQFLQKIRSFISFPMKIVVAACLTASAANYAIFYAIEIGHVSSVLIMVETFLILVLAGEHIFLGDKKNILRKLLAVVLAIVGAVCILVV